jgi:hypothetical protein
MAGQIVKKSKHEAISRELRLISGRLEQAARVVDDIDSDQQNKNNSFDFLILPNKSVYILPYITLI